MVIRALNLFSNLLFIKLLLIIYDTNLIKALKTLIDIILFNQKSIPWQIMKDCKVYHNYRIID